MYYKRAISSAAFAFLMSFFDKYTLLDQYDLALFHSEPIIDDDMVGFKEIIWDSLHDTLNVCLMNNDKSWFFDYLDTYYEFLVQYRNHDFFELGILDNITLSNLLWDWAMRASGGFLPFLDVIFENIIIDLDSWRRHLIDYEWMFSCSIPFKYVLWRCLFIFGNASYKPLKGNNIKMKNLYNRFDISFWNWLLFILRDNKFKKYVFWKWWNLLKIYIVFLRQRIFR